MIVTNRRVQAVYGFRESAAQPLWYYVGLTRLAPDAGTWIADNAAYRMDNERSSVKVQPRPMQTWTLRPAVKCKMKLHSRLRGTGK